jgi:hypothetical protein
MRVLCVVAVLIGIPALLTAETPVNFPGPTWPLPPIVRNSGMIFSGTVLKVEHLSSDPAIAPGVTRITFRVENAIRGVRRGQVIQIREWEGLWGAGEQYRSGEQVFLFLYPSSKLGLTSPVAGSLGRHTVNPAGQVLPKPVGGVRPKPIDVRTFTDEVRRAAEER